MMLHPLQMCHNLITQQVNIFRLKDIVWSGLKALVSMSRITLVSMSDKK